MPDIPAQAVRAAVAAYTCAGVAGVGRHEELVSVVLEAAAPGIAAHEEEIRADERRKTITSLRDHMDEISGANLKDQGNRLWITTYGEIAAWLDRQLDEQTGEDQ